MGEYQDKYFDLLAAIREAAELIAKAEEDDLHATVTIKRPGLELRVFRDSVTGHGLSVVGNFVPWSEAGDSVQ